MLPDRDRVDRHRHHPFERLHEALGRRCVEEYPRAAIDHGLERPAASERHDRPAARLGFNRDERGSRVFDGMNTHIAARQLAMNIRFGAPSGAAEMYEAGSEGALWWDDYTDTARGRPSTSLLARCRATETCPKIVETFGSAEFYSLRMSQNMVGTRADRDIPLPANVRRYYSPSTRHGGGPGGFVNEAGPEACCILAANPNPETESNRALMHALVDWVVKDAPPPPSRYPRLDRGELVAPTAAATGFPLIPGQPVPDGVLTPFYDYDFGPGFRSTDVSGVMSVQPYMMKLLHPKRPTARLRNLKRS